MKTARLAFYLCFSLVFSCFAYSAGPRLQSQAILEKVFIEKLSDRLEITLQLTQKTNFNSFSLTGPNRLVIDLFETARFSSSPLIDVNAIGVQKIRTAINRPGIIRVVLDLQDKVPLHKIVEEGNSIKIELWYELKAEQIEPEVQPEIPVTPELSEPQSSRGWRLGFGLQVGYDMFRSDELKDYFGKGTSFAGGEVGVEYSLGQKSTIGFQGSFKFIRSDGKGDYLGTKAKFSNSPMSFTFYYLRESGQLMPFAGIGLDYNYYRLTYPEGLPTVYSAGVVWGGNLLIGVNYLLSPKMRIKIVYNYHFATASEGDYDVVLSGSGIIASLSFWFGL